MDRPQPKRFSSFFKGFVTGSITLLATCTGLAVMVYRRGNEKRHNESRGGEILKYGEPVRPPPLIYYSNHVLSFDSQRRTPVWVAEHLTKSSVEGNANRRRSKFQRDPEIDPCFLPDNTDFWNSGWSRGHMAPAGNNKHSQKAMDETFYFTNILPQNIENNTGFWNRLEIYCRELTEKYKNVRVISGPLYLPTIENDNKKYVKYEAIGLNNVAVPTHLYKVILADNEDNQPPHLGAFIVPNAPITSQHDLEEFQVPLEVVEKDVGVKFFSKLNREKVADLCKEEGCHLMTNKEFQLFYLSRRLEKANSIQSLEKVWSRIQERGLETSSVADIYNKKKAQLSEQVVRSSSAER